MTEKGKIPLLADPSASKFTASQEAWRVFGIMSEFVEAAQRLAEIRPAVSIFGSARTAPDWIWPLMPVRLSIMKATLPPSRSTCCVAWVR